MTFKEVCVILGLPYTSDWGIINPDGYRVVEFIDFVNLYKLALSKGSLSIIRLNVNILIYTRLWQNGRMVDILK